MAIDLMGSRFYMQQMSASRGGTKKAPTLLKKDYVDLIETIMDIKLPSLMKMTKPDLETLYDTLRI
jgi:hypothetical protein